MSDFWEGFWIGFRRGARWGVPMLLGALAMAIGWVADKDSARRELAAARDSLAVARADTTEWYPVAVLRDSIYLSPKYMRVVARRCTTEWSR